jgi:hypothetical protein
LGDGQRNEGIRPKNRVREGRRLERRGGKVKAVRVHTKGADKRRGVKRVRGESVVGHRLEGVRVGKARRLRRSWGQSLWRLGVKMKCGGGLRVKKASPNSKCITKPYNIYYSSTLKLYFRSKYWYLG